MAIFKAHNKPGKLKHSIIYADKDRRRENDYNLTIGINCSKFCNIAILEMQKVKELYDKTGGRECQHYILSFAKGEITLPNAVEYVKAHAVKCFGERFQVFIGIHVNSESKCIHAHYIVNSVSFVDGGKIQTSKDDYNRFRDFNDELARKYGLTVIDRSPSAVAKRGRPQLYSMKEYQLQKKVAINEKLNNSSYVNNCFNALQLCLEKQPKNLVRLILEMKEQGWYTKFRGKQLVFINRLNSKQRVRANTLAKKYNMPNVTTAAILEKCNERSWQNYISPTNKSNKQNYQQLKSSNDTNSITAVFASLHNPNCKDNDGPKRPNKMRIRLHNEDYENDSYGM